MDVTIHRVAKRAKVSVSTASRILNGGTKGMRRDAAERARLVIDAAHELGYRPNAAARSLVMKRSFSIGFISKELSNPIRGKLLDPLQQVALSKGFQVLVNGIQNNNEIEPAIENMLSQRVEGLILGNTQMMALPFLKDIPLNKLPVVGFGQETDMPWDSVIIDYHKMTRDLTTHLIQKHGARRITFVGPASDPSTRLEVCLQAIRNTGINEELKVWNTSKWSLENGRRMAQEHLESGEELPDALVCSNDLTALGIIAGLRSRGIKVPDDVIVTGIDNIEMTEYCNPTLTTAGVDSTELARQMFGMLYKRIADQISSPPIHVELQDNCFLRESCGCNVNNKPIT